MEIDAKTRQRLWDQAYAETGNTSKSIAVFANLIAEHVLATSNSDMKLLREALRLAIPALRAPMDGWKGELEAKALTAIAALAADGKEGEHA